MKLITRQTQLEDGLSAVSGSTFILPFKFKPQRLPVCSAPFTGFVQETADSADWGGRELYFTRETSCVLFEHAKRFVLSENICSDIQADMAFSMRSGGKADGATFQVCFDAPKLVLFEWHPENKRDKPECVFHTGFLLLSMQLDGDCTFEDWLVLNDLLRCWRPRFGGQVTKVAERWVNHIPGYANFLQEIQEKKQANEQQLDAATFQKEQAAFVKAVFFDRWDQLLSQPVRLADGACYEIVSQNWRDNARYLLAKPKQKVVDAYANSWLVSGDERAYIWTHLVTRNGADDLSLEGEEPTRSECWNAVLNADNYFNTQSTAFNAEWVEDRTYTRWLHEGSMYGFSYHSGAFVTNCSEFDGEICQSDIASHVVEVFKGQYLDMALLLLYLRVSLFRFSERLNDVSAEQRRTGNKVDKQWMQKFEELREQFAQFTNLYQFPLISHQQQMIEMYSLARKHMQVDELFVEIESEISDTHQFFDAKNAAKLNDNMLLLTVAAAFLAIVSLAVGLLGPLPDKWNPFAESEPRVESVQSEAKEAK